tara:strand:- start:838 stop:1089 length:252 start_codon:yes stop_codon:yes gene_type:complete
MSNVTQVGNFYVAEINGAIESFSSETEANAAYVAAINAQDFKDLASAYVADQGLTGKVAAAKANVIISFLNFQAASKTVVNHS